jgi:hypothetical protein
MIKYFKQFLCKHNYTEQFNFINDKWQFESYVCGKCFKEVDIDELCFMNEYNVYLKGFNRELK